MTAVSAAVDAVCRGDERGFAESLTLLAAEQSPGWTQAVSWEIASRGSRATDEEGWASGLAAADMAALHNREQVSA